MRTQYNPAESVIIRINLPRDGVVWQWHTLPLYSSLSPFHNEKDRDIEREREREKRGSKGLQWHTPPSLVLFLSFSQTENVIATPPTPWVGLQWHPPLPPSLFLFLSFSWTGNVTATPPLLWCVVTQAPLPLYSSSSFLFSQTECHCHTTHPLGGIAMTPPSLSIPLPLLFTDRECPRLFTYKECHCHTTHPLGGIAMTHPHPSLFLFLSLFTSRECHCHTTHPLGGIAMTPSSLFLFLSFSQTGNVITTPPTL